MKGIKRIDNLPNLKQFTLEAYDKFEAKARYHNRSLKPWNDYDMKFLIGRLSEEVEELKEAFCNTKGGVSLRDECLDVLNFAWFIYEKAGNSLKEQSHED